MGGAMERGDFPPWPKREDPSLIELKREFTANQLPDLVRDLAAFIADHPILRDLPKHDQESAALHAATHLLLAIRSQSIVGLVR